MSEPIYHWHHIVPRHAGGTDDPSNLVKLTIQEHAEAHRLLWEQYGRLEDKLAWQLLSRMTPEAEETRRALIRQSMRRPEVRRKLRESKRGEKNPQFGKSHSVETKQKLSEANMGHEVTEETRAKIRAGHLGKVLTQEHREKLREAHLGKSRSEDHRRAISEGNRRRYAARDPEDVARQHAALKERHKEAKRRYKERQKEKRRLQKEAAALG